jgi:hypothetical protein
MNEYFYAHICGYCFSAVYGDTIQKLAFYLYVRQVQCYISKVISHYYVFLSFHSVCEGSIAFVSSRRASPLCSFPILFATMTFYKV